MVVVVVCCVMLSSNLWRCCSDNSKGIRCVETVPVVPKGSLAENVNKKVR